MSPRSVSFWTANCKGHNEGCGIAARQGPVFSCRPTPAVAIVSSVKLFIVVTPFLRMICPRVFLITLFSMNLFIVATPFLRMISARVSLSTSHRYGRQQQTQRAAKHRSHHGSRGQPRGPGLPARFRSKKLKAVWLRVLNLPLLGHKC